MKKLLALSLSLLMILGTTSMAMAEPAEGEEELGFPAMLFLTMPDDVVYGADGSVVLKHITINYTVKDSKNNETLSGTQVMYGAQVTSGEADDEGEVVFSKQLFLDSDEPYFFKEGDVITIDTTEPAGYSGTGTFSMDILFGDGYFPINLTKTTTRTPGGGNIGEEIVYSFTSGAKQTWDCDSATGPSFTAKTTNQNFKGVGMDKTGLVPTDCYTRNSETNTITLKPEYLRTLKTGEHTIRILFGDGMAETTFTLTGDCGSTTPVKEEPAYTPEVKPDVKPSPDTGR